MLHPSLDLRCSLQLVHLTEFCRVLRDPSSIASLPLLGLQFDLFLAIILDSAARIKPCGG